MNAPLLLEEQLPGPSSLSRIAKCPTSEGLPHFQSAPHEWTRLGDIMHAFLEAAYNGGRDAALEWAFETNPHLYEALEGVPLERLPSFGELSLRAEVSFAYDIRTGKCRTLGYGLNRNIARAMAQKGEMVGTLDLAGTEDSGESVFVIDWKSGFAKVEPAADNWQIKTGLLMACRAMGLRRGRCAIVRVLWNGLVLPWEWHEMDEDDLDAHAAELRLLMRLRDEIRAKAARGEPLPPPVYDADGHCRYCPAQRVCPVYVNFAHSPPPARDEVANLPPERRAAMFLELRARKKALELAEEALELSARQDPILLPDGQMYGEKLVPKETIVADRAEEALAKVFPPEVARAVVESAVTVDRGMTKEALKRALKRHVVENPAIDPDPGDKRKQIGKVNDKALDALRRDRLGMDSRTTKPVCVFRPGKEAKAEEASPPPPSEPPESEAAA